MAPMEADNEVTIRTAPRLRQAVQQLLRYGVLDEAERADHYRVAVTETSAVNRILEPLDLCARVDEIRGLVFVAVLPDADAAPGADDWAHPLVRRERLNLEQSLLVAILRKHFIAHEAEAGAGTGSAAVDVDEIVAEWNGFVGTSGSDSQDRSRVRTLLEQLRRHGVVGEVSETDDVRINPLIAHLANPASLAQLIETMRAQANTPA